MERDFSGNHKHNIDPKGRATIPAVYRDALGAGFTVALNNEFNAIALYPAEKWQEMSERLNRIPASDIRGMTYVRLIKAFSFTGQNLDAQGRILLPQVLRDKAGMNRSVRFLGMGQWLEIWDEARFSELYEAPTLDIPAITDYVNDRYFGPSV